MSVSVLSRRKQQVSSFDRALPHVIASANERNVVLRLHSTTKGAQLKAAVEGITIELGDAAR